MTRQKDIKGRLQLAVISLVFFGPLILAAWLYFSGSGLTPEGRTNHGALLEPIVNIGEALPRSTTLESGDGRWLLVYVNEDACGEDCEFALYTLRQSRLMLGKEMDRLERLFLHGDTAPDTVLLTEQHAGLISTKDSGLSGLLQNKKPAELAAGGLYLIDPLGNLVMYFHPGVDPSDMVEDIKRLLKHSRIG